MSVIVIVLRGKGTARADTASIHQFATRDLAMVYVAETHKPDQKYWVTANIIDFSTAFELYADSL
jgi:hypothetical protein